MKEKFIYSIMLLMLVMTSCSKEERVEYPAIASATINSFLLEIQDSEGNSLINNEDFAKDITFIQPDGYKFSGHLKYIEGEKFIESNFPLPLMSEMTFSKDKTSGYGNQQLAILINGIMYDLQGEFHYTNSLSDKEMYGGSVIKLTEIKSNNPFVSKSVEFGYYIIKIVITIEST